LKTEDRFHKFKQKKLTEAHPWNIWGWGGGGGHTTHTHRPRERRS